MWLEPALAFLESGRFGAALDVMLEAWRARRLSALANAIDRLSDALTASLPPVTGKTRKALQEQWLDLENARRPVDVGLLLAAYPAPPFTLVGERIERLAALDDPRVTKAFAEFLLELPTLGGIGLSRWTRLFERLSKSNDARVLAPVKRRLETPDDRKNDVAYGAIERAGKKLLETVDEPKATKDELALISKLVKAIDRAVAEALPAANVLRADRAESSGTNEASLLAGVYARPEDDEPRLVYSDWLQERGDARGELVALQLMPTLTAAQEKRVRKLLKANGRAWLGPLEPVIEARTEEYARGFVSQAHIVFRTAKQRAALLGHPAWNTLTKAWSLDAELLAATEFAGLEELTAREAELAALRRRKEPLRRLRTLGVGVGLQTPELLDLPASAVRGVERIEVMRTPEASSFSRLPPSFSVPKSMSIVWALTPGALEALQALPNLNVIELWNSHAFVFRREPAGWTLELKAPPPYIEAAEVTGRVAQFLSMVTKVMPPGADWDEPKRSEALRQLERRAGAKLISAERQ